MNIFSKVYTDGVMSDPVEDATADVLAGKIMHCQTTKGGYTYYPPKLHIECPEWFKKTPVKYSFGQDGCCGTPCTPNADEAEIKYCVKYNTTVLELIRS